MNRYRWKTAAALLGMGLFCGCASTTTNPCNPCGEQREGLFSRLFGQHQRPQCDCVETGRMIVGDGPVIPEPGCVEPGALTPGTLTPGTFTPGTFTPGVVTPGVPTMPPPTALPTPNPLAQPIPANPSSQVKSAGK